MGGVFFAVVQQFAPLLSLGGCVASGCVAFGWGAKVYIPYSAVFAASAAYPPRTRHHGSAWGFDGNGGYSSKSLVLCSPPYSRCKAGLWQPGFSVSSRWVNCKTSSGLKCTPILAKVPKDPPPSLHVLFDHTKAKAKACTLKVAASHKGTRLVCVAYVVPR